VKYRTIVADPPWDVMAGPLRSGVDWHFRNGTGKSQPLQYGSLSVQEIAALPVGTLAENDAALFLWTINAYVEQAYAVARAWGFKPSTLLTWAKNPMGGGLGGAFGITTEHVLYARRGSPEVRRTTGTWFQWKRHYENGKPSHSSKPDHFYDLIEQVSQPPYVELFSRRHRLGWDVWGNESANTATLEPSA
jgi:N6-adenosine-specific RNA methylase IME4